MLKKLHSERLFQYCIPCILIACSVNHLLQAYCKFPLTFVPFWFNVLGEIGSKGRFWCWIHSEKYWDSRTKQTLGIQM